MEYLWSTFGLLLGTFGVLLGHFGVLLGHFWSTFGALLEYFWGTFGVLLGNFWGTFGVLLEYFWSTFRVLLEYFWNTFAQSSFGVFLDYFLNICGDIFWNSFGLPAVVLTAKIEFSSKSSIHVPWVRGFLFRPNAVYGKLKERVSPILVTLMSRSDSNFEHQP